MIHLPLSMHCLWRLCQTRPCFPNIPTRPAPAVQVQIRRMSVMLRVCHPHTIPSEFSKLCCHLLSHVLIHAHHLSAGRKDFVDLHLFLRTATQQMNTAPLSLP